MTLAPWIVVAIFAGLASNLGSFFFRHILKDGDDSTAYAWLFEAMRLVIFLLISIFNFRLIFSFSSLLTLVGLGIIELVSVFFMMKMHAYSHLSISTIILRTRLIWIPLIAFILFRESLTLYEYIGIIVLFLGLSIATASKNMSADRGMIYAYITAFTTALVNIYLKLAAPFASTSVIMVFMSLPSVIFFPMVMKSSQFRLKQMCTKNFKTKLLSGFINACSLYLLAAAVAIGPVSKVSAIYQGMMVVSIFAGIIFLHETQNVGKKIIGSIITTIGVLLLTST